MKIFIVLPALNEKPNLPILIGRFEEVLLAVDRPSQILIVDDGSTDGTAAFISDFRSKVPLKIESFPENRGVAKAFQAGFDYVCSEGRDHDLCFTMDADNTQDPRLIIEMIPLLERGADIVIASRFIPGGSMTGCTAARKILSAGLSKLFAALFRLDGVTDYSTFYRGYRVGVIRRTLEHHKRKLPEGCGFESYADFLLKAAAFSTRIEEIPAKLEYQRKLGTSKMKTFKTILYYLLMAAKNKCTLA